MKTNTIKSILKTYSLIYWSVYLIKSFIQFEFRNPFNWILELNKSIEYRLYVLYIVFVILTLAYLIHEKSTEKIN